MILTIYRHFLVLLSLFGLSIFCEGGVSASYHSAMMSAPSSGVSSEISAEQTGIFLDTVTIGALDKVTARTSTITFRIGEPKKIGTLIVRALRAWKSNPEEEPEAKVFFEVHEQKITNEQKTTKTPTLVPLFRGWMFQSNRSISTIDHPVYDFWVLDVEGAPHDGIISESKKPIEDPKMSAQIHELIDQLMDEDVSNPIAIEPLPFDDDSD